MVQRIKVVFLFSVGPPYMKCVIPAKAGIQVPFVQEKHATNFVCKVFSLIGGN